MKLLEKNSVGTLLLKNRIAFPPITTGFGCVNGCPSQDEIDFVIERAKGGAALIFTDAVAIDRHHLLPVSTPLPYLDSDEQIGKFSRYADAIHHHGAKACIQLYHAGRQTSWNNSKGRAPLSPSSGSTNLLDRIPFPDSTTMSKIDIEQAINGFALAASRAQNAGFDAIDIDGGAGYLIQQFMSPLTNKRKDKWGGSLENRLRFPVEIIARTRDLVGDTCPLFFDLCLNEYREGGITPDEGIEMAKILEPYGIDAFRIHGVTLETYQHMFPTMGTPEGPNIPLGKALKRQLKKARVLLGQQIHDSELAESALNQNAADVILLGRPMIADPYFAQKLKQGKSASIRKCIACNHCADSLAYARPIRCSINPTVGFEREYSALARTDNPKKVLIVGGGPAGMECARVAAGIGHKVMLFEKSNALGGQLRYAAETPYKKSLLYLLEYYNYELRAHGIDLRLNQEIDNDDVLKLQPDVIILATGAKPVIPNISGTNEPYVWSAQESIEKKDNLIAYGNIVIIGGGPLGSEIAEMLALQNNNVTLLEMNDTIAHDMGIFLSLSFRERLKMLPIDIRASIRVTSIHDHKVGYIDAENTEHEIAANLVVVATGYAANSMLEESLKEFQDRLITVGDCVSPRKIVNAVHEGFHAARLIN